MLYVITYDIPADQRRARVAKAIEGYGQRVQRSVFECDLTERQYAALRRRLAKLIRPDEGDSLRTYRLCAGCASVVEIVGDGPPVETSVDIYIV